MKATTFLENLSYGVDLLGFDLAPLAPGFLGFAESQRYYIACLVACPSRPLQRYLSLTVRDVNVELQLQQHCLCTKESNLHYSRNWRAVYD